MESIKWAVCGAILALGLAAGSFYLGRKDCPRCGEIDKARVLTELLIPTQKLLLAESSSTQRYNWELVSTWPRLAKLLSHLGPREKASGYLQYQVKNYYGYDLTRPASWSLKREGNKFIFEAPPLRLLTCPAVLTQSLMFVVEGASPFVGELSRQGEIIRVATVQALAVAHDGLRDADKLKRIKDTADQDLKSLLISLARPMGWTLQGEDIVITNPKGLVDLPPPWQPALEAGGKLDLASVTQLKNAGCS